MDKQFIKHLLEGGGDINHVASAVDLSRQRVHKIIQEDEYLIKWRKIAKAGTLAQKLDVCAEMFGDSESYGNELEKLVGVEFGGDDEMGDILEMVRDLIVGEWSENDE